LGRRSAISKGVAMPERAMAVIREFIGQR